MANSEESATAPHDPQPVPSVPLPAPSFNVEFEDTLWIGVPGDYTNLEAPAAIAEVRKLVDNGDYAEATKAVVKLSDHPSDGSCPGKRVQPKVNSNENPKEFSFSSDWADLYAHHLDDYQNLFHRVSLRLSKSSKSNLGDCSWEMKEVESSTKTFTFQVFAYFFFTTRKSGVKLAGYIEPAW
ncbi:hypothetical protein Goshw_000356, partial [Gossypium schwendimanii]|nr:hypothetical protein [Gossypium schwendimanii]